MESRSTVSITRFPAPATRDDGAARDRRRPATYDKLHCLARAKSALEPKGCSLQPALLIHESCERLVGREYVGWAKHRHFFAAAAEALRRILVKDACYRGSPKPGGGWLFGFTA
jgi:hypothetical protein